METFSVLRAAYLLSRYNCNLKQKIDIDRDMFYIKRKVVKSEITNVFTMCNNV